MSIGQISYIHSFNLDIPSHTHPVRYLAAPQRTLQSYSSTPQGDGCSFHHLTLILTMPSSWNNSLRHAERRRPFNIPEFKRLAAASINRKAEDVARFEELAEGGFNRTFLITMCDGFQIVGRIPYPNTEPKHLVVASEVATMKFLRLHNIPVPEVYGYDANSDNAAGTEYMFMEMVSGTNLGDVWFDLSGQARIDVVTDIVELEAKVFDLRFPASGSLYYAKDLPKECNKIDVPIAGSESVGLFCVGPDTRLVLWYGKRREVETDRGPCTLSLSFYTPFRSSCSRNYIFIPQINFPQVTNPTSALSAGATKEIAYLRTFGRPLHSFQRLYREIYAYQKQAPSEHISNLNKCLQIAPHLIPPNPALTTPTLRHPDLQPINIFISDDLRVTGLIDWHHTPILPLFLQCGIPNNLQNYADPVSQELTRPKLPPGFDELSDEKQFEQVLLLRKRQLHYFYVEATEKLNPVHFDALTENWSAVRKKVFDYASAPWEGEGVGLKVGLIR